MKDQQHNVLGHPILWIVAVCGVFWFLQSMSGIRDGFVEYRHIIIPIIVAVFFMVYWYLGYTQNLSQENIIIGIFLGSLILRGLLMLVCSYDMNQHDTHFFGNWETGEMGSGHFGYIQYLFRHHTLPDFDPSQVWSFYNPPLHHGLSALWMQINQFLGLSMDMAQENLQVLSLLYATLSLYGMHQILKEFILKGWVLCLCTAVLAFHPILAILSLALNNDPLSFLFIILAILYTIRWYKNHKTNYILAIALSVGFGMMTKVSAALIAPAIGLVFLIVLAQEWREGQKTKRKSWENIMGQFAAFAVVCIPLGMWWPLRLKLKFGLPFTYVQSAGGAESNQYVGGYNALQRLEPPNIDDILGHPWHEFHPATQHNIWGELLRSSILDEWNFQLTQDWYLFIVKALLLINVLLALATTVLFIVVLQRKGTMNIPMKIFCGASYTVFLMFFIKFCFDAPLICTENFRYIVPTLLFTVLGTGIWLEESNQESKKGIVTVVKWVVISLSVCFVVLSIGLLASYGVSFGQRSDILMM